MYKLRNTLNALKTAYINSFFVRILDNVIDTVYIRYAIDKGRGSISTSEVHHVYGLLYGCLYS